VKFIINQGTTFQVSDEKGNMPIGPEYGLYYQDTRFLNDFNLTINGQEPLLLTSNTVDHYSAIHYLTNPEFIGLKSHMLSIIRRKFVGEGMHEDVDIVNHSDTQVNITVEFEIDADFADIFEIRLYNPKVKGKTEIVNEENGISFRYVHGDFIRKTSVHFESKTKPQIENHQVRFPLEIPPKGSWHSCVIISVGEEKKMGPSIRQCNAFGTTKLPLETDHKIWFSKAPKLDSDDDSLNHCYEQCLKDLVALKIRDEKISQDVFILAAGIPWFSTLFGRDSLIVAYQTLIINRGIDRSKIRSVRYLS